MTRDEVVEVGIQVNGKLRGVTHLAIDADEHTARAAALAEPGVQAHVGARPVKRLVYKPGRIINLLV